MLRARRRGTRFASNRCPRRLRVKPTKIKPRMRCRFPARAARFAEAVEYIGHVGERLEAGGKSRRRDDRVEWFARTVCTDGTTLREPLERRPHLHAAILRRARAAAAESPESAPPPLGCRHSGRDGHNLLFHLARTDHPVDPVLQRTRSAEAVLRRCDENGVALSQCRLHRSTLSGTPVATISGLKCGSSRRPSKSTSSTPGGTDAHAALKRARFPDFACRLPARCPESSCH
jgi:hypothetical protein